MGNRSSDSHYINKHRVSFGAGVRSGIAKDQLIFIIICAVAVTVAAVTLVRSFSRVSKVSPGVWQCVDCGDESIKKLVQPPVTCPKCGGKAVRLGYRDCPACNKKVLYCRMDSEPPPEGGTPAAPAAPGRAMMLPVSIQYRVNQEDGSFTWGPWMNSMSAQAQQTGLNTRCPECGAGLFVPSGGR